MSEINTSNGRLRPSWTYTRPADNSWSGYERANLEMFESIRNVLEGVARSQMLQCDVAHAIKRMDKTLQRIDKRLAKLEGVKIALAGIRHA